MSNLAMIETIANALGDLKEKVIFVGGSVAELYADCPEVSDIRPTKDVDCFLEIHTYFQYTKFEDEIRKLGFKEDTTQGAPICRKIYRGIRVDFMPNDEKVLGFSNRWYADGIIHKKQNVLPNGTNIYILHIEYYLASKFEALFNRGGKDIRGSHDWEDIVYIMDNSAELVNSIKQCNNIHLIEYFQEQYSKLLKNNNIREIVYAALPYNSEEESINKILSIMNELAIMEINLTPFPKIE